MTESTPKADILIVDDNPVNLRLLQDILQEQNYEVRAATSGRRALATVRSSPPDLVMLDITMPEMNGYEVCRVLKTEAATAAIPVIFISALDEAMDKVRAFAVGAADYVTKPFQYEEVLARVENQIKIARLQRDLERRAEELERKNDELEKKNQELVQVYRRAGAIFSAFSEALPGFVLDDRYRLDEKIGVGTSGVVYRATQLGLNRTVAVKILRPRTGDLTPEGLERFRSEGVAASRINHPNVVLVLDFGITASGIAYLAMELLEGHTLARELRDRGALTLDRCAQIVVPICDVLSEAHSAGLIHRGVTPENIFLHQGRDGEVVKVLDFGLASLLDEGMNLGERVSSDSGADLLGLVTYTAPERFGNLPPDERADVYSLGVVLYEMLTGRPPFRTEGVDPLTLSHLHLTSDPQSPRSLNPAIPPAVETVVLRALSKDPAARPSAKDFGREFIKAVLSTARTPF